MNTHRHYTQSSRQTGHTALMELTAHRRRQTPNTQIILKEYTCYRLNCVFHLPYKLLCPNPQDLRMGLYLDVGPSGGASSKEPVCQCKRLAMQVGKIPGEGNGNPPQYSCLENPMDRGAWQATVRGVAKSQTQLKWLSTHACLQRGDRVTDPGGWALAQYDWWPYKKGKYRYTEPRDACAQRNNCVKRKGSCLRAEDRARRGNQPC